MSLVKTLAKVAIGVAIAKGASAMMKQGDTASASGGGGLSDMLGQMTGSAGGGGGLGDMLGQMTGGTGGGGGLGGMLGQMTGGGGGAAGGGLADMLGQLTGGAGGSAAGGGLGDMLGQLTGSGAGQSGGGLGGLLGQMTGGAQGGGLGGLLAGGGAMGAGGLGALLGAGLMQQDAAPSADDEALAGVILRAMLQAAKSDGRIDEAEQAQLEQVIGDLSEEEKALISAELRSPIDIPGLVADVPPGAEMQVYMMSLAAIDLDSRAEADYMRALAGALQLSGAKVNAIHQQTGEPALF